MHIIAHIIKNTDWEIVTLDRLDISGNLNRLHEILEMIKNPAKPSYFKEEQERS